MRFHSSRRKITFAGTALFFITALTLAPLAKPLSPDIVLSSHPATNSDFRMDRAECVRPLLLRLRGGETAEEISVAWTLPENSAMFSGKTKEVVRNLLSTAGGKNVPVEASGDPEKNGPQSEQLLLQLMGLFAERHGRMPTETEIKKWSKTFREASESNGRSGEKAKGRRAAEVKSVIHISGFYVDLEKARVIPHTRKRERIRGPQQQGSSDGCTHCKPDGRLCDKRATYWDPQDVDCKLQTCRQHAPAGFLPAYKRPAAEGKGSRMPRTDRKEASTMRCAEPGCATVPSYGELDLLTPTGPDRLWYCMQHKAPHHINCRTVRCRYHGGCSRQARFGAEEDKVKLFCGRHAPPGHMNLADPTCSSAPCRRRATFGRADNLHPNHCRSHRLKEEVDLVHKRCEAVTMAGESCYRQPSFGQPGGPSRFCAKHRGEGHVVTRSNGSRQKRINAELSCTVGNITLEFGVPCPYTLPFLDPPPPLTHLPQPLSHSPARTLPVPAPPAPGPSVAGYSTETAIPPLDWGDTSVSGGSRPGEEWGALPYQEAAEGGEQELRALGGGGSG